MASRQDDKVDSEVIFISPPGGVEEDVVIHDSFTANLTEIKSMFKGDRNMVRRIETRIAKEEDRIEKAGSRGAESKQILVRENAYTLFDLVEPPYNLATLARLYEASAPNYAAINAKVAHLVGLGFGFDTNPSVTADIIDTKSDSARKNKLKKIEKLKFDARDWIDAVSEERSFIAVMNKVVTDLESTGVGYIEVGRTVRGDIGYIGHIPSHTVRVRRAKDGFLQMAEGRTVFFANFGESKRVKQNFTSGGDRVNELIQIKKFSPTNTYYGVPDVVSAKEAAYGLIAANAYNLDYFNNKGVPRYVVSVEGAKIDRNSERHLLEFLRGLKGNHHRTIVVPLPTNPQGVTPKLKFDKVEADIQEGSFTKYKSQSRDEVLMAHRTPLSKVGSSGDSSLANSRDLDRAFKEQVIRPAQELIESKVNWIIKEKTDIFKLSFNEFTLTDEDTQSKIDERDLKLGSLMPNERRSKLGLPPVEGGDTKVELSAKQSAEETTNRDRDSKRSANSPDSSGDSRNPKGEGRSTD